MDEIMSYGHYYFELYDINFRHERSKKELIAKWKTDYEKARRIAEILRLGDIGSTRPHIIDDKSIQKLLSHAEHDFELFSNICVEIYYGESQGFRIVEFPNIARELSISLRWPPLQLWIIEEDFLKKPFNIS
jgi:hypothetical protein